MDWVKRLGLKIDSSWCSAAVSGDIGMDDKLTIGVFGDSENITKSGYIVKIMELLETVCILYLSCSLSDKEESK